MEQQSSPYDEVLEHARRIVHLEGVDSLLSWDQQVMMPPGGTPARSRQRAEVSAVIHETVTSDELGAAIAGVDPTELDDDDRANYREIRRRHDRVADVPDELIRRHAERSAAAQETWEAAREADDFATFADPLDELTELRVEIAEHADPDLHPYETMYVERMPTLPLDTVREILEVITPKIRDLLGDIRDDGATLAAPFADRVVPPDEQAALSRAVLEEFGFDEERSRLDSSAHPFTSGTVFDTRYTTRYVPEAPLDGFTATMHEYGHATYNLGLPSEEYGTFLGKDRREVHESQSRFWENHVGRSEAFCERVVPTVREHISGIETLTAGELYEALNRVAFENPIRVEADELTYNLHIRVRADIEGEIVNGELRVADIPDRWNELMDRYLDLRPDSDANGCLQDVHWVSRYGGFQTYTVGTVLAAQLTEAMRADVDVEGCIHDGAFDHLREWMGEHIHRHGRRYETPELIEQATGAPLSADPYLRYLEDKYRALYDV